MNFEAWENALKHTEVVRSRYQDLEVRAQTSLPYIFLAESAVNPGDTLVRKGYVIVEKPLLIMPPLMPLWEGFDIEGESQLMDFLMIRGVHFPSLRYNNQTKIIDVFSGGLSKAKTFYAAQMQRNEDLKTSLILGHESSWQCSVMIFVGMMMNRSLESDLKRLLSQYGENGFE